MKTEMGKYWTPVTVVIIDDSSVVRRQVKDMLQECSHIQVAGDTDDIAAGLDLILEKTPDYIILDISMPGGSGFRLLEYIKNRELPSKVIMLTNYTDICYRNKAKNLGADFFFDKSHDFEKIVKVIGGYADRDNLNAMKNPDPPK
jgi:DNA-binding NarL/FixJ family response regulator